MVCEGRHGGLLGYDPSALILLVLDVGAFIRMNGREHYSPPGSGLLRCCDNPSTRSTLATRPFCLGQVLDHIAERSTITWLPAKPAEKVPVASPASP